MVFFKYLGEIDLASELAKRAILINPEEEGEYRLVTHIGLDKEAVDKLLIALEEIL